MISIQFLVSHVMLSSALLCIQTSYKNGWNFISKVSKQRKKSFFFPIKIKRFFLGLIHLASNRPESGHRNSLSGLRLEVECWFPPKWENSLLPTKFTSPKIPKGNYSLYSQEFQLSTILAQSIRVHFLLAAYVFSKALVLSDYPPLPRSNIMCIRLLARNQERILYFKVTKVFFSLRFRWHATCELNNIDNNQGSPRISKW